MADDPVPNGTDNATSNPPAPLPEPTPPPPPPASAPAAAAPNGDLAAVLTAIAALPETIARSVRESTPAAPTQTSANPPAETKADPPASGNGTSTSNNGNADERPGPKSLRDWWFGN